MCIRSFVKQHWLLLTVFFFATLWRVIALFDNHEVWWDAGVYIGMGKWLWSAGSAGLWEHIRPPGLPLFLGMLWTLGFDPVVWGRLVSIALSLGAGALVYSLCARWFNARSALFATILWLFSPIVAYMGFHQYTEIPAAFFALLALWLIERNSPVWAGVAVGLTFLMKFPAGMFLLPVLAVILLRRSWLQIPSFIAGFLLPVGPFLAANSVYAGSMFGPLQDASAVIREVLGCNVLRAEPWWHYFALLLTSEVWGVHLFALLGIVVALRVGWRKTLVPLLCVALPLIYHINLPCREYRYLILFLPFVCMLTGFGIERVIAGLCRLNRRNGVLFIIAAFFLLWFSAHVATQFYLRNEQPVQPVGYFTYLQDKSISGEVWVSDPTVAAYTDLPLKKIYYPVYHKGESTRFSLYLHDHLDRVGAVLLDNCGGGIICIDGDTQCEAETKDIIDTLSQKMTLTYNHQFGGCWYKIFEKPSSS